MKQNKHSFISSGMLCIYCGRFSDALLCPCCSEELENQSYAHVYTHRCLCCKRPIQDHAYPCAFCLQGIQAYAPYTGIVSALLGQFKTDQEKVLAKVFAPLYISMLTSIEKPLLLPVPSSRKGFSDRGFDQMLLVVSLLEKIAGYLSLRLFTQKGEGQSKFLSLAERKRRHAVSLLTTDKHVAIYKQKGYDFVLLDDICTTGSTLETCKTLLYERYGIAAYSMVIALV